jgi:hypothetical protein
MGVSAFTGFSEQGLSSLTIRAKSSCFSIKLSNHLAETHTMRELAANGSQFRVHGSVSKDIVWSNEPVN